MLQTELSFYQIVQALGSGEKRFSKAGARLLALHLFKYTDTQTVDLDLVKEDWHESNEGEMLWKFHARSLDELEYKMEILTGNSMFGETLVLYRLYE